MSEERSPATAEQFLREIEGNEAYLDRQRREFAERDERRREYAVAANGLFADLAAAGIRVTNLVELRRKGDPGSVPILAGWLKRVTYLPLKRDIVATLGSNWARPLAAQPLIDEFRRIDIETDRSKPSMRWVICDALERVANEAVVDELMQIAAGVQHGVHRGPGVVALGNMRRAKERVLPILVDLLRDEDVAGYAVMGLGKLRAREARAEVERFLSHPDAWIRKEARKALAKMGVPGA